MKELTSLFDVLVFVLGYPIELDGEVVVGPSFHHVFEERLLLADPSLRVSSRLSRVVSIIPLSLAYAARGTDENSMPFAVPENESHWGKRPSAPDDGIMIYTKTTNRS